MKKITIIASLMLLFPSILFAGEFSARGVKLGFNSSKFIGKDIPGKGVSSIPGFALGGFVSYEINKKFSIQQELLVTAKGSKINTIGDMYLTNAFIYFEMPLLVKMTFQTERKIIPFLFCGSSLGVKCLAVNEVGLLDDIRNIDWGLILGAGVEFWKITMDVRYNRGLLNFDQSADDIDLKNLTISIMFGFCF